VLLVEGDPAVLARPAVAIVGTRACTAYGRGVARHLAASLAQAGVVVVSGLARGIDGEAHLATLGVGPTVAVVGHGLGTTAPPSHADLRRRLVACGGVVVSTWPDDEPPRPWHFPERNAWIAGLAQLVVVVEAPARSGALITARAALAEGREVAAVPGPLGAPASVGCLELIEEGARVVADVARFVASIAPSATPGPEAWLADLFAGVDLDAIARRRGRTVAEVLAEVARLEVEGRVVRVPGGRYACSGSSA
jgi:DNA processing protein